MGANRVLAMSRDRVKSSRLYGTAVTSDVVFSIEMTSLPVGGMMMRIDCGMTMRHIVWVQLIPRAVAASSWPRSTERMPARMISARYAASFRPSPMTARVKKLRVPCVGRAMSG